MVEFFNNNPAITALIVLTANVALIYCGWKVLYRNAKRIATRNETFSLINSCLTRIDDLCKSSVNYWSASDNDYLVMVMKSKQLELEINSLKQNLKLISSRNININFSRYIRKLRQAMTLDAQNKNLVTQTDIQIKVEDIYFYSESIKSHLIEEFQNIHSPT